MLPAAVALVLGGARVKSQLDDASRLSTVRDQVGVLRDAVNLSDLSVAEMSAAVPPGPGLDAQRAAVDQRGAAVRQAAAFTQLPAGVVRTLSDALDRLGGPRPAPRADPLTEITGHLEAINNLR